MWREMVFFRKLIKKDTHYEVDRINRKSLKFERIK